MDKEEGKCAAFLKCLPTTWQGLQSNACRYNIKEEGKFISYFERDRRSYI